MKDVEQLKAKLADAGWRESHEEIFEGDITYKHPSHPDDLLILTETGRLSFDLYDVVGRLLLGDVVLQREATTYNTNVQPDQYGRYPVASTGLIFTIYSGVDDDLILNDLSERGYR